QRNLLSDAERLTTIGKFVRKTSLDEIPQLIECNQGRYELSWSETFIATVFAII
ncbi:sugar transferase, partial [Riemerella anatipestifer]|uniref:sugar transferase n=1 Tax=Riemerella anatipestifer TaxID=34085 RepID=UPI003857EAA6